GPPARRSIERFSFVLRTSWAWAGSTIPQSPKERQFIAWGRQPEDPETRQKKPFSSPGGATVAPWPSPTVARFGAWNGERLGPLRDILGLTNKLHIDRNPLWPQGFTCTRHISIGTLGLWLSGDNNSDPLLTVLIPTPVMPSCYRLLTPSSGSFLIFTSVSRWVCSGSTFVNLDRINPLLRFSRSR